MYGYSFIVQLYNNDKEKGMKGIEFPKGDITFDIDLKFERSNVSGSGLRRYYAIIVLHYFGTIR